MRADKSLLKNSKRTLFLVFFTLWCAFVPKAQPPDYAEIFGDDWKKAAAFEKENRYWMEPVLRRNHLSYNEAIAVIFPELVRYSALRDKMEITLLKALYVNLGEEYANFSVGQFQIKPSFASLIRTEASYYMGKRSGISFSRPDEFEDIRNYRKSIIVDLEDPKTQFNYIVCFLKICEKKYKIGRKDETGRIKFLSTAYNYGIERSRDEIERMTDSKFFSTKLISSEHYSYSDVALFWYNSQKTH